MARSVFPRNCALAGWRQSWSISRAPHRSERDVQREYMSPRFMVDRKALAGRTYHSARGSVRRSGFLRSSALRGVLHLRADGLCLREFIYGSRVLRSSVDAGDGSPSRPGRQTVCEIDGVGRGLLAFLTKPNGADSAV